MLKEHRFAIYNNTRFMASRSGAAFTASSTSRRLIMFQVWFSRINAAETLHSYNERLGRPRTEVRRDILPKTKSILKCAKWREYFDALGLSINGKDLDQLLRFAVFNSAKMGYHRPDRKMRIDPVAPPQMMSKKERRRLLRAKRDKEEAQSAKPTVS